jgi:hypothetical protein
LRGDTARPEGEDSGSRVRRKLHFFFSTLVNHC